MAGCTSWGAPSKPLAWPRRSPGGPAPRSSPSTTGSPPSTRTRPRSTTLWPPTKPSCRLAPTRPASPSRPSPPPPPPPPPPCPPPPTPPTPPAPPDLPPPVAPAFQASHALPDEAAAALDRAGQLLSAHLTGSQTTGGAEQLSEIKGVARFKFHEGKVEEFKRLSAQAMDIVRAKDTGTLQYEIYFNEDQSECVVYERYRDSEAVIEHGAHVGHLNEAIFATGSGSSELLGEPSADLTAMMAGSGVPPFRPFLSMETPLAGFDERAPGSVDTPPHRSVRSGTASGIGIRR